MKYIKSILCLIPVLLNVVQCEEGFGNSEDSRIAKDSKFKPIKIDYFEYEFPINHNVIPFSYTLEDSAEKNSAKSEESRLIEDSSSENINNMNLEPRLEPSYTSYSFIRSYNVSKSCPLDDDFFSNRISKFSRFGSGRDNGYPDLDDLIEHNKTSNGVLLVDFFATWCGPCKLMNKNLEVIREHYRSDKLIMHAIDVDRDRRHIMEYKITSVPSILLFVGGEISKKFTGLVDVKTLIREIDDSLDSLYH